MSKLFTKIREEILEILPAAVFFLVALHIVAYIRVLMLKGTGIAPMTFITVTLSALVLGKAVVVADLLPIINRFPEKPLLHNVAWKTAIYFFVAFVLHYLERLVDFWRETGDFAAANEKLLASIIWPHFWAIQIILLLVILMYCVMHELARVIGGGTLKRIFFGPLPIPSVLTEPRQRS
jgi:hypothetical protein